LREALSCELLAFSQFLQRLIINSGAIPPAVPVTVVAVFGGAKISL